MLTPLNYWLTTANTTHPTTHPTFSDDELDEIEYDNERLRIEAMLRQERDDNREMNAARSW